MKHPNGDAYTTSDYARLAIHNIAPIAFFAFAAVLLIALCIAACNEAAEINAILNHKK
jgi:hypothetical protein